MNQQILKKPHNTAVSHLAKLSFLELVQEMKSMDMDPKPILKVAALDIFSLHGANGITYAEAMLDQMIEDHNPDGIFLWNELYCILNGIILESNITIH